MSDLPSREAAQAATRLNTNDPLNRAKRIAFGYQYLEEYASGRLVDREAIDRNKANGVFYAALGAGAGFGVAFDAMLDAALLGNGDTT